MKVYCENCKWYYTTELTRSNYCNKFIKQDILVPIHDEFRLNWNNSCPYYEEKESLLKRIKQWFNWKKER